MIEKTAPPYTKGKEDVICRLVRTNRDTTKTGYNAFQNTPNAEFKHLATRVSTQRTRSESGNSHQSFESQGEPPSSSLISCCNTMEYTLAFRSVKTVAVLRSRPRNESRISTEGFAASSARIPESYRSSAWSIDGSRRASNDVRYRGCRRVWRIRLELPAPVG